jgi:benzoylformate decarboxylase
MGAHHERSMRYGAGRSGGTGADILLEVLRSEGTRYIFGNPGPTELPLIDSLVTVPEIKWKGIIP